MISGTKEAGSLSWLYGSETGSYLSGTRNVSGVLKSETMFHFVRSSERWAKTGSHHGTLHCALPEKWAAFLLSTGSKYTDVDVVSYAIIYLIFLLYFLSLCNLQRRVLKGRHLQSYRYA